MKRPLASFVRATGGNAAAEFALMLPILVVLLFGGLEVAHYFYNQHQVVKGVRDGARYASRLSFAEINCDSGVDATVEPDIKAVTRTGTVSGGTARVRGWGDNDSDVTVTSTCPETPLTTGIYANESNAPVIDVAASVPYQPLFGPVGLLGDGYLLQAEQRAAVMGI